MRDEASPLLFNAFLPRDHLLGSMASPRSGFERSSSSSDFVLLTTTTPLTHPAARPVGALPLPPPRFRPALQAAAVIDLAFVLGYGAFATVPLADLPASAVALNVARSIVVLVAVSSSRVREKAPILLGQVIVSRELNRELKTRGDARRL